MPRKKSVKKLVEEREIAQSIRKKELEAEFEKQKKTARELGVDWSRLFRQTEQSMDDYVGRGLEKWNDEQPIIVTGRFQDNDKVTSIFQQRFVECLRTSFPYIFEELRNLIPYFNRFFKEKRELYYSIFNWYRIELWDADESLDSYLSSQIRGVLEAHDIFGHLIDVRPNKMADFRYDYKWGQYRLLLELVYLSISDENERDNASSNSAHGVLRRSIAFPNNLDPSQSIDKESVLSGLSRIIIHNHVTTGEPPYFVDEARRSLSQSFKDISPNAELDIDGFIKLHLGLLRWAEKYDLEKDWILRYAYFFISQFSINPDLEIQKIHTPYLNQRSLVTDNFRFKFEGWLAGDETRESYEKRLRTEFENSLEPFFQFWGKHLKLAGTRKTTKPLKYDCVKWNVYGVIRKWNADQVLEKFFPDIAAEKTKNEVSALAYENKIKVLKREIKRLAEYDIPIPGQFIAADELFLLRLCQRKYSHNNNPYYSFLLISSLIWSRPTYFG